MYSLLEVRAHASGKAMTAASASNAVHGPQRQGGGGGGGVQDDALDGSYRMP